MLFAGGMGLTTINRESYPPVDFSTAKVETIYPGSSPEEVEEKITKKIEDEIRTVSGIREVLSVSQAGRSSITVRIELDGVDSQEVMDDLQSAVQRVTDLPDELPEAPVFSRINSKEIPVLELALVGSNEGRKRDALADQLKTYLEDSKQVSYVRLSGFREREFQILLDPIKMAQNYVGISEVVQAVSKRVKDIPAGFIRPGEKQYLVRVQGKIRSAEEMKSIVVRSNFQGQRITIDKIAQVEDGMEDPTVLARVNGKGATLLTAAKKEGVDAIRTTEDLRERLDLFKETSLPAGYEIIAYNDEADRVKKRLAIVTGNAIGGLVLVLVVLLAFLPGVLGFTTALSLPLGVMATVGAMSMVGVNFNTITMLAMVIAIGMLVDNAVVISENYARLREEGEPPETAAIDAVKQFWLPITATVLTTIAAFLPMLVTKGIMGRFIMWIPIVVTIALVISLIEAFILLPARLQFTLRKLASPGSSAAETSRTGWFERLRDFFENQMARLVKHRYWVCAGFGAMIFGSLLLAAFGNRFELFPKEGVERYIARYEMPTDSNIRNTDRHAKDLAQKIYDILKDEVDDIVIQTGVQRAGLADPQEKNGDDVGMIMIFVPRDKAMKLVTSEVLDKLRAIPKEPFRSLAFQAAAAGPPVGSALNVTFKGNSYDRLRQIVNRIKEGIIPLDGVKDVEDDRVPGGPELGIHLDYEMLSRLQLSTETVGTALRTALQGAIAEKLNVDNDEFDLRIRYADQYREARRALEITKIREPGGQLIPLSSIATISNTTGPPIRKHFNYLRSITISADVDPAKITSIALNTKVRDLYESMKKEFPDISVKFGGEEESTKESVSSLFRAMLLAVLGIFAILVFIFSSFSKSFLVLSCIPLGLTGVSGAFFVHNKPLGFFALIGVVGLAGVVVNSAIVLVSFIDDLRLEGKLSLEEILPRASSLRLRAVMATSLTTIGGLFPTAYAIGGYDAILVPMTLALAWGLVSGTILTLIWVPCGYAVIEDMKKVTQRFTLRLSPQSEMKEAL